MRIAVRQPVGRDICLVFVLLLLAFVNNGCSKDESSPTSSTAASTQSPYPTVPKNWAGSAHQISPEVDFTVSATFTQTQDSILSGIVDWRYDINECQEQVVGTVTTGKRISLTGTSITVISGGMSWTLDQYSLTLSTHADTLSGTWTDVKSHNGTIVLRKI